MEKPEESTRYRFRVRAPDGREAVSNIVSARRAPDAHAAGDQKAEVMLANPRWSADAFADGDHGALLVDAPGLEGRTVRFEIEHRDGEEWKPYEKLEAKVENGIASAQLQLRHPAPGEKDASAADLRFSCQLV
jgi:hypothetical protein